MSCEQTTRRVELSSYARYVEQEKELKSRTAELQSSAQLSERVTQWRWNGAATVLGNPPDVNEGFSGNMAERTAVFCLLCLIAGGEVGSD